LTTNSNIPKNLPSNFFMTQLSNGLQVLVIEDHSVPLATIELVVKNGAFVQTPDIEGLAHLYEHMFFKANKTYPSQEEYMERVKELGIDFNGTTSNERVNYFFTLSNARLNEGLQFMNSAARFPLFLEEEMNREREVVASEFQRDESNPFFFLHQDMEKHLWGELFPRKNAIGRYEVILSATPAIMQKIKDMYYYPDNSMLCVAGDVNNEDVFIQIQTIFGDWQHSGFDIFQKYPIPEFSPLVESAKFVTENPNAQVPVVYRSWIGPDTRNDILGTYVFDVFSYILGQKHSKLQLALVETGLAFQVSAGYSTMKYSGPIQVLMVPNPDKVKEAIAALDWEINQWDKDNYFTDDQLLMAKEMLEVQETYEKEKTSEYLHLISYWWASATIDYYLDYVPNIRKVTREDIKNYVNKYISGKPNITGVLVSKEIREAIKLDSYFL